MEIRSLTADGAAELISMWVAPEMGGTGAGDVLMDAVMGWADSETVETVSLSDEGTLTQSCSV